MQKEREERELQRKQEQLREIQKKTIAEKAPTALPSVQFSGKFNILESGPMQKVMYRQTLFREA